MSGKGEIPGAFDRAWDDDEAGRLRPAPQPIAVLHIGFPLAARSLDDLIASLGFRHHILSEETNLPTSATIAEWYEQQQAGRHRVARSFWGAEGAEVAEISTIFLGFDHGYLRTQPRWFETMTFAKGSDIDLARVRCETFEEAVIAHREARAAVTARLGAETRGYWWRGATP